MVLPLKIHPRAASAAFRFKLSYLSFYKKSSFLFINPRVFWPI